MKNLIFAAYAEDCTLGHTTKTDIYLQNACCCLLSAKKHNPNDTVAIVTNVQIPICYEEVLKKANVEIFIKPFDTFFLQDGSKWCFAFYKLCALLHMVNENIYDKLLLLDTDVITIGSYRQLWQEAEVYLMMHQVVHHYDNANEAIMRQELKQILNMENCIHWGGEFVCGKTDILKKVLDDALQLFAQMEEGGIYTTRGDEFIWTAALGGYPVKSAIAYIDRYWTGKDYYFVNTHAFYPGVVSLHLPNEKQRGIPRLYRKLKKNRYPSNERLFNMMRMPKNASRISIYSIYDQIDRIKRKLLHLNNVFRGK